MALVDINEALDNQPIVVDQGSGLCKAGLAGSEMPKLIMPTYVGRPKHRKVMTGGADDDDVFVGDRAHELRGILKLSHPIKHGVVENWEDMNIIWQNIYEQLAVPAEQHPVLLTEAPLNPRTNRIKSAETMFEGFNVPALYFQIQAILSLYASGRTTGIVLDSGDGVTTAVPVFEGFVLPHAVNRIEIGGRDVTEYLQQLLRRNGHAFHTTAEAEIVRGIKEKSCFIAYKNKDGEAVPAEYKLPDGSTIQLGAEKYRAPEVLFNPSLVGTEYLGIHQVLVSSVAKCDMDIRLQMYGNILLAGGSTMFDGFGDRLLSELRHLAPRDTKVKIWAPPERIVSAWIGGSILASLATFKRMWLTRKDWNEAGASALFRYSF